MPAKPQWLLRIPAIREYLRGMDCPVLDRASCERLFGVRRRRAIELMHFFGGYKAGNTVLPTAQSVEFAVVGAFSSLAC